MARAHDVARFRVLEIAQDFGETEHAHGQHGEIDAVRQILDAERHALLAGFEVGADGRRAAGPSRIMPMAFRIEPRASTTAKTRPMTISEKYSAGPNSSASLVSGAPSAAMTRCRDRAGEERADRRDAERHAGAALLGHLVAVERGDDGGRLARNVDQDGRRRAAILRAVIDAREHDERAGRVEAEGDRQQHRDGGDRPDARQHADQRADEAADEAEKDVLERQGDAEAEREITEERLP